MYLRGNWFYTEYNNLEIFTMVTFRFKKCDHPIDHTISIRFVTFILNMQVHILLFQYKNIFLKIAS